jgi:hypothetical protein
LRRFWKRRDEGADWPEPRPEFLQSLADDIRGARGRIRTRGLKLAFVVVAALALLVPLSAMAGRPAASTVSDAVKAVTKVVRADTSSSNAPTWDKPKKPKHDHGDDDDDDDDDYDYNKKCPDFGKRRAALAHHQKQERVELKAHQRSPHPGFSKKELKRHFKLEWRALHAHQKAERDQLKKECGKGRHHKGHHKRHHDDDD